VTVATTSPVGAVVSTRATVATAGTSAVFTRLTVVAPRTRIDVALPSDVALADLLPMLLSMARETTPDGGARHGGWCLARIGEAELDTTKSLNGHVVLDGELLQLRKRSESPPPPLYDDVIDAVALSTPASYRPWTAQTARVLGAAAAVMALLAAATVLYRAGPGAAQAITAAVAALALVGIGAVISRVYQDAQAGVVLGAAALPLAFVAGLFAVPGGPGRPNVLLACVATAVLAAAAVGLIAAGVTTFVSLGAVALLGAIAGLVAVLVAHPVAGIGAGLAAAALVGLSAAPRMTIQLARLPVPAVPTTANELTEDDNEEFPDVVAIERQAAVGHQYLSGMVIGFGVSAAIGAVLAAQQGMWGVLLSATVAVVLMLRARTYANGVQAVALLLSGVGAAAGIIVGWAARADAHTLTLWPFGSCVLLGLLALVLGVVFPQRRFSPVLRRSVELAEAVLIALVLPLALAVMDLYSAMRHL